MSIRCMTAVWDKAQVSSTTLLVLLCLADFADDKNLCFPSQSTIAQRCRMNERNVRTILKRLEDDGLIERIVRGNITHSTRYRICVDKFCGWEKTIKHPTTRQVSASRQDCASRQISVPNTGIFASDQRQFCVISHTENCLRSTNDPPIDPPLEPSYTSKPKNVLQRTESKFEFFWKSYPRKINKGDALKAWSAGKCDRHIDTIINALEKHKVWHEWTKENGKFIPYPATWLRRLGWENELEITGLQTPGMAVGSDEEWK